MTLIGPPSWRTLSSRLDTLREANFKRARVRAAFSAAMAFRDRLLVGEAHIPGKIDPCVLGNFGDEGVDQRAALRLGVDGGEMRLGQHFPHDLGGVSGIDQVIHDQPAFAIARLSGIDDRDAAEALKGERLYVPKSALPEAEDGAYYHADLIGLRVETAAGEKLGTVKAVHNFGAGDVIEITGAEDKDGLMVPFTDIGCAY